MPIAIELLKVPSVKWIPDPIPRAKDAGEPSVRNIDLPNLVTSLTKSTPQVSVSED